MKSKFTFESGILSVIILILLAVGSIGYFAYRSMSTMVEAVNRQTAPNEKLLLLKEVSANLEDADNLMKTYLLTPAQPIADSLHNFQSAISLRMNRLGKLTADNAGQKTLADSLASLIGQKFKAFENTRKIAGRDGIDRTLKKVYKSVVVPVQPRKDEPKKTKQIGRASCR